MAFTKIKMSLPDEDALALKFNVRNRKLVHFGSREKRKTILISYKRKYSIIVLGEFDRRCLFDQKFGFSWALSWLAELYPPSPLSTSTITHTVISDRNRHI